MLTAFCSWLGNTPLSQAIANYLWFIPLVQTVHILGIATIMASVVMVDFRLLGIVGSSQSISNVAHRFMPWVWGALAVLAFTGSLLIIGEPGRELLSQVFWAKMILLAVAVIVMGTFHFVVNRRAEFWERKRVLRRALAIVSLVLFVAIVVAGRWIAYWAHG